MEELDLLGSDVPKVFLKILEAELDFMQKDMIVTKVPSNNDELLALGMARARYEGASILVSRIRALKQFIRD